jgi:hypothetical protein
VTLRWGCVVGDFSAFLTRLVHRRIATCWRSRSNKEIERWDGEVGGAGRVVTRFTDLIILVNGMSRIVDGTEEGAARQLANRGLAAFIRMSEPRRRYRLDSMASSTSTSMVATLGWIC